MTCVLIKRGNVDTEIDAGRSSYEHKAEIREMYLQAKELQRLPVNDQKSGARQGTDSPPQSLKTANPADLRCLSPELGENTCLLFMPPAIVGN